MVAFKANIFVSGVTRYKSVLRLSSAGTYRAITAGASTPVEPLMNDEMQACNSRWPAKCNLDPLDSPHRLLGINKFARNAFS